MTARFRCVTCGGEYDDESADGVPYYHACPPEPLDAEGTRWRERPNKRDENPPRDQGPGGGRPRAEGLGRVRL